MKPIEFKEQNVVYGKDHKIKLIEIPYTEINNIETILRKELKIK